MENDEEFVRELAKLSVRVDNLRDTAIRVNGVIDVLFAAVGALMASHPNKNSLLPWFDRLEEASLATETTWALADEYLALREQHRTTLRLFGIAPQTPPATVDWKPPAGRGPSGA